MAIRIGCWKSRYRLRLFPARHNHGIELIVLPAAIDRVLECHVPAYHWWRIPTNGAAIRLLVRGVCGRIGSGGSSRSRARDRNCGEREADVVLSELDLDVAETWLSEGDASGGFGGPFPYVYGEVSLRASGW